MRTEAAILDHLLIARLENHARSQPHTTQEILIELSLLVLVFALVFLIDSFRFMVSVWLACVIRRLGRS